MPQPKPLPAGGCGDDAADKYECPTSPPSSSHGNSRLVTALVVTASVLVFFFLTFSIYCFIRRRRRRQRQEVLLAAAPTADVDTDHGGGPADDEDGGGEEVVHHAWHILTIGLDEAAIKSIALTRYRAGAGMLGAADCSVCLAEFMDGELVRLLPKCGHAFHVPCIDTWLRAHVNCPLCRADVLDPAAAPAGANAATADEQAASNTETMEHEQPGQQQGEQQELRVEIDQRDQSSSPEPPHRHPASRAQIFRRAASMNDSSLVPAEEAPEDEQQNSKEKQGTGDADCRKVSSGSGRLHHMKRSLSGGGRWSVVSRHCRTRSAMLPL